MTNASVYSLRRHSRYMPRHLEARGLVATEAQHRPRRWTPITVPAAYSRAPRPICLRPTVDGIVSYQSWRTSAGRHHLMTIDRRGSVAARQNITVTVSSPQSLVPTWRRGARSLHRRSGRRLAGAGFEVDDPVGVRHDRSISANDSRLCCSAASNGASDGSSRPFTHSARSLIGIAHASAILKSPERLGRTDVRLHRAEEDAQHRIGEGGGADRASVAMKPCTKALCGPSSWPCSPRMPQTQSRVFSSTAARMRAFNAFSSILSPS